MSLGRSIIDKAVKKRKKDSHKGDFGRVLVIGGSIDYPGAIFLAASSCIACLRTGTDLATLAAPEKVAWAVNSLNPDIITKKLKGDFFTKKHLKEVQAIADKSDVILIGPGIGQKKETKEFIKAFVRKNTQKLKVIDADAIKSISIDDVDNAIITPHKKELEILLKNSNLTEKNFRKKLKNNVILLKGSTDYIISMKKTAENKTGNPGMTVGGTGDVLAGMCAGFLAQNKDLFASACAAAYLNGRIGDRLKKEIGYGFIASDFLSLIPKEINKKLLFYSNQKNRNFYK